jgi:mono/diheme cytochrome c family protein
MYKFGIVGVALSLIGLVVGVQALTSQNQNDKVTRGEYLVQNVAMCIECHTPRNTRGDLDRTKLLQGAPIPVRAPFPDQQWAFRAPKIAGLPGWDPSDAVQLLETSRRPSGIKPKSPMPGYRMVKSDAESVVAYLKSLP